MSSFTVNVRTTGLNWVDKVMSACAAGLGYTDRPREIFCEHVPNCFYKSVDEVAKANLAARQSTLALWPAIISSLTAIHPDPEPLAYDSLLWAAMFAITSGGAIGLSQEKPKRTVLTF